MSDRLLVGTRKGLFDLKRHKRGWTIDAVHFAGDPVSMLLPDARDGAIYAALNLGHFGVKLRRSDDGGRSFADVTTPAYAEAEDPDDGAPSVMQIWALEAGGGSEAGTLWCGTIPGGLFRSEDRGGSWQLVESLWDHPDRQEWFGGGADEPGVHSICVHPDDPRRVALGVSCGGVWVTSDSGASWVCRAEGMYAEYMPPERRDDPRIQDPHRVVRCAARPDVLWAQHHNGVFRSIDDAASWQELHPPVSKFGFAVSVHPQDAETAWLIPAVDDEHRIPVDGALVVTRTRDGGATWQELRDGLPQSHAYDLVYRHALDVDGSGQRLAFGSTTGGLWLSEDEGDRWETLSTHLPPIYCLRFM